MINNFYNINNAKTNILFCKKTFFVTKSLYNISSIYYIMKFLIINDFNDINDVKIRHFSLDKGHFMAKSLHGFGHEVYFLTIKDDYEQNGIKYIHFVNINTDFIDTIDYVMIVREPLFIEILNILPALKNKILIPKKLRKNPKIIVKSDSPIWFTNKVFIDNLYNFFGVTKSRHCVKQWIVDHVDYICAQNEEFKRNALFNGLPLESILVSNMGISNNIIDFDELINPYDIDHKYCVDKSSLLTFGKALWPHYYVENPEKKSEICVKKNIIVYTGRIKTNGGKVLFNMSNIMKELGDEYELHIFPGSFVIPSENDSSTSHSGKNTNSLNLLRDTIFKENKNIFVHYPYIHEEKYRYLHFADCGIDFSDIRPKNAIPLAGHAKILEYCESGLPVVCEENIQNLFLIKNGNNGIILPYMASDLEYAEAIKKIQTMNIDRQFCRNITVQNENWDIRAQELLNQLE